MKRLSLFPRKRTLQTKAPAALDAYWTLTADLLLSELHTTYNGIQQVEAESRIKQYGPNTLKVLRQTTAFGLLLSQFKSPLVLQIKPSYSPNANSGTIFQVQLNQPVYIIQPQTHYPLAIDSSHIYG